MGEDQTEQTSKVKPFVEDKKYERRGSPGDVIRRAENPEKYKGEKIKKLNDAKGDEDKYPEVPINPEVAKRAMEQHQNPNVVPEIKRAMVKGGAGVDRPKPGSKTGA